MLKHIFFSDASLEDNMTEQITALLAVAESPIRFLAPITLFEMFWLSGLFLFTDQVIS